MANEGIDFLRIQSKIKYKIFLILYFILYPICKILYGRKKNWIICERGNDAQDNGFIFFKYIIEEHKDINITYLINKRSVDYKKVADLGKCVQFGSLKHFLLAIGVPVKISSQLFGYAPWVQMATYFRRNVTRDKHIFLQHGIIKNAHEGLYGDVCKSLDLFVCGAKPEYDFIYNTFHYLNGVPQYTGLARYDNLLNQRAKKQILIMPTWRTKLVGINDSSFLESVFFINWQSLISDSRFIDDCKKNGFDIIFYLHYELQKYSHLFHANEIVKIVNYGEKTVQQLLMESSLLITDFSSVFFDFAYMEKPVIFFQFDELTFNSEHYSKGYFDYRVNGFGPVCNSLNETIKEITYVFNNSFNITAQYKERIDGYFIYKDKHNCDRIFEAIQKVTCK